MLEVGNVEERIVYEDNHLLAFDKPGGLLTQGDSTGDATVRDILMAHIKVRDQKPGNVYLHPCHRLDRTVSGVILLAKTSKALPRMHKIFRERTISKRYIALCDTPAVMPNDSFEVEGYIKKNRSQGRVMFRPEPFPDAKYSKTHAQICFVQDNTAGVILDPETGRPHQLRVHLYSKGMTIKGDVRYGGAAIDRRFIHLHAHSLKFVHPVKKEEITICAPPPNLSLWKTYLSDWKPFLSC